MDADVGHALPKDEKKRIIRYNEESEGRRESEGEEESWRMAYL